MTCIVPFFEVTILFFNLFRRHLLSFLLNAMSDYDECFLVLVSKRERF